MDVKERKLEDVVLTPAASQCTINGVVIGLMAGLAVFIATNWLVLKGGAVVGTDLVLLAQFFPGYRVTFFGSRVGFAYGLLSGAMKPDRPEPI